ncbi:MAG: reprolysin-like metallopeptidase [Bacteroidota bacterium]
MIRYVYLILLFFTFSFPLTTTAQSPLSIWQLSNIPSGISPRISAHGSQVWQLDEKAFSSSLLNIHVSGGSTQAEVQIPLPNQGPKTFIVQPTPIMEAGLATRFPTIKAYAGYQKGQPEVRIRLTQTPNGFDGMVLYPQTTIYLDRVSDQQKGLYMLYDKHEAHIGPQPAEEMPLDETGWGQQADRLLARAASRSNPNGATLRTYRLAMSTTAEYANFHRGTGPDSVANVLAAIATTMNRVNGIYEREFAVRMVLVNNNDQLIFFNAATDPFDNGNSPAMLGQNQATVDRIIGAANYDIGHVFGVGSGGIASLGSVCELGQKARGVTGTARPVGDPFDVDFVAHEIGHQFGGRHTFNGTRGSCSGNRSQVAAYEPGSGSTIMAYAGICGGDNLQQNSDDYFHTRSYDEIRIFINQAIGSTCGVTSNSGNTPPQIGTIRNGFTIPISTPFRLRGQGFDNNGDTLTYCWEQFDLGPSGPPNEPANIAPIFRSYSPVSESFRIFPRLNSIVNNTTVFGEVLPTTDRIMNFRLTARDNRGGVNYASYSVRVTEGAGPFVLAQPNGGEVYEAGSQRRIFWDKANTDQPPVNCQEVNIFTSVDGGFTYPFTIATNVPNTTTAIITVPDTVTKTARIMIEAADNLFLDISDGDFSIERTMTSIDAENLSTIEVFPNPVTQNQLWVQAFEWMGETVQLELYDLAGKLLWQTSWQQQSDQYSVQLPLLPNGLYAYRLRNEANQSKSGRLLLNK